MTVSDILDFKIEHGYILKCVVGNETYNCYFNYKVTTPNLRIYDDHSLFYMKQIYFKDIK